MARNKPEIVAYLSPIYGEVVSQQDYAGWEHEASRNPDTEYGDYYKSKTLEYSEPLIRLSDYATLQAECEELRKASSELANWCVHEVGVDVELTPGLQQVTDITENNYVMLRCEVQNGKV